MINIANINLFGADPGILILIPSRKMPEFGWSSVISELTVSLDERVS